jgi:hypothetical protein
MGQPQGAPEAQAFTRHRGGPAARGATLQRRVYDLLRQTQSAREHPAFPVPMGLAQGISMGLRWNTSLAPLAETGSRAPRVRGPAHFGF